MCLHGIWFFTLLPKAAIRPRMLFRALRPGVIFASLASYFNRDRLFSRPLVSAANISKMLFLVRSNKQKIPWRSIGIFLSSVTQGIVGSFLLSHQNAEDSQLKDRHFCLPQKELRQNIRSVGYYRSNSH